LLIEHQKNDNLLESKTKNLVKIAKREMDYFETVIIRGKPIWDMFLNILALMQNKQASNQNAIFSRCKMAVNTIFP
jgi:predicted transcriptional regulator